jgi:hypothetical protein
MESNLSKKDEKPTMMQMILEKKSKIEMIRSFAKMDLYKVAQNNFPSLNQLSKIYGSEKMEKIVCVLVADLNVSFDGELLKEQVEEISIEIMSGISSNMPLELVFVTLQEMKYADTGFGKLTINKVLRAVRTKFNEYQKIHISQRESEHFQVKQQPIIIHQSITEMWKKILDEIPSEKRKNAEARDWYLKEKKK